MVVRFLIDRWEAYYNRHDHVLIQVIIVIAKGNYSLVFIARHQRHQMMQIPHKPVMIQSGCLIAACYCIKW